MDGGRKESGIHLETYLSPSVRVRVSGKTGTNFWRIHFLLVNGPAVGLKRFLEKESCTWGMAGKAAAAVHVRSNRIPSVY
jgi:hypothetical protein